MSGACAPPLLIGQREHTPVANAADQTIIPDQHVMTYRGFADRVAQAAGFLAGLGRSKDAVIAVKDHDSHRYFECFFSVSMLGAQLASGETA